MQTLVRLFSRKELVGVNSAWENLRMTPWLTGGERAISPKQLWEWELVNSEILPQIYPGQKGAAPDKAGQTSQVLPKDLSFRSPPPLTGSRHILPRSGTQVG